MKKQIIEYKKMKFIILIMLACIQLSVSGQINFVSLTSEKTPNGLDALKNKTVHVIVKDFCDDTKLYKKILQENWRYSNLSFEYTSKYDTEWSLQNVNYKALDKDEWYMLIEKHVFMFPTVHNYNMGSGRSTVSGGNTQLHTELSIIRVTDKGDVQRVLSIPLYYPVLPKFSNNLVMHQDTDLKKTFPNFENPNYFKNMLQMVDQFVDKKVRVNGDYIEKQLNCEEIDDVLKSTLNVPTYALSIPSKEKYDSLEYYDPVKFFSEYKGSFVTVTNEEIQKLFESDSSFYYLLRSINAGVIYNYIVEGKTGRLIIPAFTNSVAITPNMGSCLMKWVYEKGLKKHRCKG